MGSIRLAQNAGYIFIVRTAMTPSQVDLVQQSFKTLGAQTAEASRIFYEELFRLAPDLRMIFPDDLGRQKEKFTQAMGVIVKNLTQISLVSDDIVAIGRRHMAYDIEDEHFEVFGEALLRMLDRIFGQDMTGDMRDAWAAAYEMIMRVMQDAANAPRPAENFFAGVIRDVMVAHYGITHRNEARGARASIADSIEEGKAKLS